MSLLLIICALAAFCTAAYFIENRNSSGPRRWGWIQSWSKGWKNFLYPMGGLDRMTQEFKAENAARQKKIEEWRAFNAKMDEAIKAYKLKYPKWTLEDWANYDKEMLSACRKIKNDKFPQHIIDRVKGESPAVVGEKGKEIIFQNGTAYIPEGSSVLDWSNIPHDIDWSKFRTQGIEIDMLGNSHIVDEKVLITYRNAKRGFLPSVNPLGDTAAFMTEAYANNHRYRELGPYDESDLVIRHTGKFHKFRHRKGGRRG